MKQKHVLGIVILVVVVALGSAVGQEMKKHIEIITDGEPGCGGAGCGMNLTEDQQAKFKDLDLALDKTLLPLKSDLKVLDAELGRLLVADNTDRAAVDRKIDEIGAVKVKMEKAKVKDRLAKRALLTDEQRVHFDKCACMCAGMDMEKHMMFMGEGCDKKVIQMKRMGGDCEPLMWNDKDGKVKVEIKEELEEVEEE